MVGYIKSAVQPLVPHDLLLFQQTDHIYSGHVNSVTFFTLDSFKKNLIKADIQSKLRKRNNKST